VNWAQHWNDLQAHNYDWPVVGIITGIAGVMRLYHLDAFGVWRDEAQTVFLARQSFPSGILAALMYADVSPPLYYFLLHFWEQVSGSDWGLRFFSVILGVATIPLVYLIGRRMFDSGIALVATVCAALSPHHVVVSRTVRMYTLLPLLSLLAIYFVHRFVTMPSDSEHRSAWRTSWLGVVLSFALVMYTHNVGAYLVVSVNGFFLLELLWRKEARRLFWPWVAAQICVALLYAPWLPAVLQQLRSQGAVMGPWLTRESRLGSALRLFKELTGLSWPGNRPWLWMALVVLGTFTIRCRRSILAFCVPLNTSLHLVLFCFFGPIMLAAFATPPSIGVIPSYVTLVAFPAMCYLVARGVNAVRPPIVSLVLLLALSVLWVQGASVTYVRRTSNLREIASYISEHVANEDMIVIAPDYLASSFNYYFDGPQMQVAFPSTFGRVEHITWVGWVDSWKNAAQGVEPTLQYLSRHLQGDASIWLIVPLEGYPRDPYFSQVRVLKSRLDEIYGYPQVVDSFEAAVESAGVYIYG
jgi:mannosyltransferase